MAETRSSVVHLCARRQQQLGTLLGVGQEHPLFQKQSSAIESLMNEEEKWERFLPRGTVPRQLCVVS